MRSGRGKKETVRYAVLSTRLCSFCVIPSILSGLAYIQFTSGTDSDPKASYYASVLTNDKVVLTLSRIFRQGIFVSHAAALTHLATFSAMGSTANQKPSINTVALVAPPRCERI